MALRLISIICALLCSMLTLAAPAFALDKGLYFIAESRLIGDQSQLDALRREPIIGDLIAQLEASSMKQPVPRSDWPSPDSFRRRHRPAYA